MANLHRNQGTMCRFTPAERALLDDLRISTGLTLVGVLRLALRDLARRQLGTSAPTTARKKVARRG